MTRPQIVRADTLDLQDHDAPSAKDHTGQPAHPDPLGIGPAAPHQNATLRSMEEERTTEQGYLADAWSSNRNSHEGSELLDEDTDFLTNSSTLNRDSNMDERVGSQNGNTARSSEDSEMKDEEMEDADDDMVDKISSSPSIDEALKSNSRILDRSPLEEIAIEALALYHRLSRLKYAQQYSLDQYDDTSTELEPGELGSSESSSSDKSLQNAEDIDFQFVYALHTFVATVEGQANATKGDTMVLLDDSNSYWWLVRVVKDSSIGYLPAEHIETPTERLARLNKHRNIDLSATMLSDNTEKSKNPLKTAIRRRRNAKMVQFSTPTYYEASDIDWSDDEEEQEDFYKDDEEDSKEQQSSSEEKAEGEAQKSNVETKEPVVNATGQEKTEKRDDSQKGPSASSEAERTSRESSESQESTSSRSRMGTIRNTDSFFKDDTAEPKKLSLTPSILREETASGSPRSSESRDKSIPSQDSFEQIEAPSSIDKAEKMEKLKEDKKRKDKKPGMLSGLFKRKEKKLKVDEAAGGVVARHGDGELSTPAEGSPTEATSPVSRERPVQSAKRPPSGGKLVKSPPSTSAGSSNAATPSSSLPPSGLTSPPNGLARNTEPSSSTLGQPRAAETGSSTFGPPIPSARTARPEQGLGPVSEERPYNQPPNLRINTPNANSTSSPIEQKKEGGLLSPITNRFAPSNEPKKEKLKKATQRMDLDVDSSPEREPSPLPLANSRDAGRTPPPRNQPREASEEEVIPNPVVSPVKEGPVDRTALAPIDTAAANAPGADSPDSPSTPTESTVQTPETDSQTDPKYSTEASSRSPATQTDTLDGLGGSHMRVMSDDLEPSWDDGALRTYLDGPALQETKDMLWRVYDTTGVAPAPLAHPVLQEVGFQKSHSQIDEMLKRLDGMMLNHMARNNPDALREATNMSAEDTLTKYPLP